jgi:hypothetical protein
MKQLHKIVVTLIALILISLQTTYAQEDYYSGYNTIKGVEIEYSIIHDDYGGVFFENVRNTLMDQPIIWNNTGERAIPETMPFAERDEKKIREIIQKVFTRKEIKKYRKSQNIAEIGVIIDPMTGRSIEVAFTLTNLKEYDDPILFSIPIQKFELLEILIKQELLWEVAPEAEKASHIGHGFFLF